jgi:hypothetical protein
MVRAHQCLAERRVSNVTAIAQYVWNRRLIAQTLIRPVSDKIQHIVARNNSDVRCSVPIKLSWRRIEAKELSGREVSTLILDKVPYSPNGISRLKFSNATPISSERLSERL